MNKIPFCMLSEFKLLGCFVDVILLRAYLMCGFDVFIIRI